MRRIRTYEERRPVAGDPIREGVDAGIKRVEKHNAFNARIRAAAVEYRQSRTESATIGDNHDRHIGKGERLARIAVKPRQLDRRFVEEMLEAVRLPEFSGA